MTFFAKFVMVDSGRAIYINPSQIEQVRYAPESETAAIYLTGKGTPIIVQENVDAVMKVLAGKAAAPPTKAIAAFRVVPPKPAAPMPVARKKAAASKPRSAKP